MGFSLLFFAVMTVLVRAGLTVLTGGVLRPADAAAATLAAAADTAAAVLAFWAVGAAFLFGHNGDLLAFDWDLVLNQAPRTGGEFFHAAAAVIGGGVVTAAVVGRARPGVTTVASAALAGVVFPVLGHLVWFGRLREMNVIDFGGASAVHIPAAVFAAVGVAMVGSRSARSTATAAPTEPTRLEHAWGHPGLMRFVEPTVGDRASTVTIGAVLATVGWLAYLMGSLIAHPTQFNAMTDLAQAGPALATTAMNALLAGAAGLAGGLSYGRARHGRADLFSAYTGLLGGLVAITPACVAVNNLGAAIIGGVAGLLVPAAAGLMRRARLDDPVGLIAVHGIGAVWGMLAAAMFAAGLQGGLVWVRHFQLLALQSLAVAVSIVVSAVAAGLTFGLLRLIRPLRTDGETHRP